ncbi:unnamed protein product [Darwinula stevensoni]|uniref:Cuticle protein n=1 Tax=Darwinula stevensoni TaxID=69355 RepID=A0A7R9ADK3_9CRUS|nr:unnamed protein product [Darwinula stevensoni]CAG0901404.1 unnamed protein product [Darwinula stevensoni]
MSIKVIVLAATLALAVADVRPSYNQQAYGKPEAYPDAPPKYDFNYAVKDDYSGNSYGHNEGRDGYNTQGSYNVLLPDGRVQTVTYRDDGNGLYADVTYQQGGYQRAYEQPRYEQPAYRA